MSLARFVSTGEALTDFIRLDEDRWLARAGGAGWNVARVVARLGMPSASAVGISQDTFGEALWDASEEAGLDLRYIQRFPKSPLLAMVPESNPPHYFFIRDDSADLAFNPDELPEGWLEAAELVHFSCLSLLKEPLSGRLVALAEQVKAAGRKVSYDPNYRKSFTPAYDPTLERLTRLADVMKVSDEDLCGLFRVENPLEGLEKLRAWNRDVPIVLTKGAQGAELHLPGETLRARALRVQVVDTVGAGDACMGALVYHWLEYPREGWQKHLEFAVAAGAAACLQAGAYAPSLEEIHLLMRSSGAVVE